MAVWALLSISQMVKAADVTVYFQCPDGWTTPVHAYAYGGEGGNPNEFVKNSAFTYTLKGGYGEGGDWSLESANFQFVGDGKYTYTFTATQTGEFRFRVNTSYTSGAALCPNVDGTIKRKELTSTPEDVAYTDQFGNSRKDNYFCS